MACCCHAVKYTDITAATVPNEPQTQFEEPDFFSCPDRLGFSVPKSTEATINANAPNSCDKLYKKRVKNIVEMTLSSTKNQCYNDI